MRTIKLWSLDRLARRSAMGTALRAGSAQPLVGETGRDQISFISRYQSIVLAIPVALSQRET